MTARDQLEQEWIKSLVCEAERDLVFLWHIATGSFGGRSCTSEELPLVIARVTTALIMSGCKVGFGDPDGQAWQPDTELLQAENPGGVIAARWLADPKGVEFLVFARRRSC